MADRRDDLDSWLDGRVEPLPPPPGTFDLIKRRARRRKYRRLAVTAGAAAVLVAAVVTVPQVVNLPVLSPTTATRAANGRSSSPAATNPVSASPSTQTAGASVAPNPAPVPAHFEPTSATFIGTQHGWVIGQAGTPGQCATQYCTSVASTSDAGKTWSGGPAPLAGAPDGAAGVSEIRFLNSEDGWAFGPELFATHNGGHTWTAVATSGLRVTDLETVGNRAFALFASCTGSGAAFADQCTSYTLYSSPATADDWAPVGTVTSGLSDGAAGAATLVLTEGRGYLLGPGGMLYAGPVTGAPWQEVKQIPCPAGTPLADGQPTGAMLAATDSAGQDLVLACASSQQPGSQQAKTLFTTADGGLIWQNAGTAPSLGLATSLAASPDGTYVLATGEGIAVRPAGSTAWQTAALAGTAPKGGFGYVGMTTDQQGIALPANPAAGTVWFSYDGGQSWHPSAVTGA
jgi:hypothetical protein